MNSVEFMTTVGLIMTTESGIWSQWCVVTVVYGHSGVWSQWYVVTVVCVGLMTLVGLRYVLHVINILFSLFTTKA